MKMAQEAVAVEEALIGAEKSRLLQVELYAKLQEMAVAEASAILAFSEWRERMVMESMAVAKQLRLLQKDPFIHAHVPGGKTTGSLPRIHNIL
jgi:hypothetical protein